jgi:hypothetical protein
MKCQCYVCAQGRGIARGDQLIRRIVCWSVIAVAAAVMALIMAGLIR